MNYYVIGVGGVGSWLTPTLCLLASPKNVVLIDGDKLEDKNLNRQLFTRQDIGKNKAEALSKRYRCGFDARWYSLGLMDHLDSDWLFVLVDNNPARLAALRACDMFGCQAIIAANETHSAEAYYYRRDWKETQLDPRVYYPELVTNTAGDPMAQAIGCTGQPQRENPQLVTANFMAASLAMHLFVLWGMEVPKMDEEVLSHLPYKLVSNLSKLENFKVGERYAAHTQTTN